MSKIIIPGKPVSVNSQYGKSWSKKNQSFGVFLSTEAKGYIEHVKWIAKMDHKEGIYQNNLSVDIKYYFPDKRRRDHLNYNKVLLDAMEGIVYEDDKQIKESHHYSLVDEKNPRVEVAVSELG